MTERLPHLYREGELLRDVLGLPGVQLEVLDEEALSVQRSHLFDSTFELEEAAKLAALLDIAPEPHQTLGEFRVWVHSLRDAMLQGGAVTRPALEKFVEEFARGYQSATKMTTLFDLKKWADKPSDSKPAFVENPSRRRFVRAVETGGVEPLQQFTLVQNGMDSAPAGFLLSGLAGGPESSPVIANMTTGRALIYRGVIPTGQRLWIVPRGDGVATAMLEDEDVSHLLYSIADIRPGEPWGPDDVEQPARAIEMPRGENEFWFLSVAHYDTPGLDRFLFALADLSMRQGRFDETRLDHSLFYQEPASQVLVTWAETRPASFEIHLPAGLMLSSGDTTEDSLAERERLRASISEAVRRLKPVGVEATVQLNPRGETAYQLDRLKAVLPMRVEENGPVGADRVTDAGGLFEVTGFNDSTFR